MPNELSNKRVIVVGASAGGVPLLSELLRSLPAGFPCPVFVVMHIGRHSMLPVVIGRGARLPVTRAHDGETIEPGHVYVAPSNQHMLVEDGRITLSHGPRENRARPAVNPLFRSAARAYQEGTVGIVLSGELDDGAAGLAAIKVRGGTTIVQDPAEAWASSMPLCAMRATQVDYCLRIAEIAPLLVKLCQRKTTNMPSRKTKPKGRQPRVEQSGQKLTGETGMPVPWACPECQGPLFRVKDGDSLQFHCLVGHSFSSESLSAAHADALERALWVAIRTLKERLSLQRALVSKHSHRRARDLRQRFEEEAAAIEHDIEMLEQIQSRI